MPKRKLPPKQPQLKQLQLEKEKQTARKVS